MTDFNLDLNAARQVFEVSTEQVEDVKIFLNLNVRVNLDGTTNIYRNNEKTRFLIHDKENNFAELVQLDNME